MKNLAKYAAAGSLTLASLLPVASTFASAAGLGGETSNEGETSSEEVNPYIEALSEACADATTDHENTQCWLEIVEDIYTELNERDISEAEEVLETVAKYEAVRELAEEYLAQDEGGELTDQALDNLLDTANRIEENKAKSDVKEALADFTGEEGANYSTLKAMVAAAFDVDADELTDEQIKEIANAVKEADTLSETEEELLEAVGDIEDIDGTKEAANELLDLVKAVDPDEAELMGYANVKALFDAMEAHPGVYTGDAFDTFKAACDEIEDLAGLLEDAQTIVDAEEAYGEDVTSAVVAEIAEAKPASDLKQGIEQAFGEDADTDKIVDDYAEALAAVKDYIAKTVSDEAAEEVTPDDVDDLIEESADFADFDDSSDVTQILLALAEANEGDVVDAYRALTEDDIEEAKEAIKDMEDLVGAAFAATQMLEDAYNTEYDYTVASGDGQNWDGEGTMTFRIKGDFQYFDHIEVDGEEVDTSNYEKREGSTIITLSSAYLGTLSAGTHTLAVVYYGTANHGDITVEASFVIPAKTPETGALSVAPATASASVLGAATVATIVAAAGVAIRRKN